MKTKLHFSQWLLTLMITLSSQGVMAQVGVTLTLTDPQSVCLNTTRDYGVMPTVGSDYTWSILPDAGPGPYATGTFTTANGTNTISVNWTAAGTCYLQVIETGSNGCGGSIVQLSITVNPTPSLTITNPGPVCSPATVDLTLPAVTDGSTLNGATLSYWEDAAATIPLTNSNAVSVSGTYYIKASTASIPPCEDIKPVTVTINPAPSLTITNPGPVCSPATVDLTLPAVTDGSTLNGATLSYWEDAAATIPLTNSNAVSVSGTYYIKASTASIPPCEDIKPVTVTINPAPSLTVTNPAPVCSPVTVDLTLPAVTDGSTLNGATLSYWEDAAATIPLTNSNTVSVSGTYYIKASTASIPPCEDIKPVVVTINPAPTPSIVGSTPVCEGLTEIYSTPNTGNTYLWTVTGAGNVISGSGTGDQVNVVWTTSGTITIEETAGTCMSSDTMIVTVNPKPTTSAIYHD